MERITNQTGTRAESAVTEPRSASPLATTSETPRPPWLRDKSWAPWAAVGAVCFGAFMGQLDASIVTLTYPALEDEFGSSLGTIQWVSLSYLLVVATLLVPVGRFSDVHGRKRMYSRGFALFTAASAACALAPTMPFLIGARAVQAVGAALLQANSIALVTLSVPVHSRRAALGIQAAAQALGLALGPTVGGVMVEHFGWPSVFWVNVPVGVIALVSARVVLPRSRHLAEATKHDTGGMILLGVAATAGLLALSAASGTDLPLWLALGLVAVAFVAATGLIRVEGRAKAPLLDPSILGLPGVWVGMGRAFGGYLVLFAPLVLFPTVFERWGLSTAGGGFVLTWLPAGFALSALGSNFLPAAFGNHRRIVVGATTTTLAFAALVTAWTSPTATSLLLSAAGAGLGLAMPANNVEVMSAVPASFAAITGGQINVARALGTSVGVAITTAGVNLAPKLDLAGPTLVLGSLVLVSCLIVVATVRVQPSTEARR